MQKKIYFASDFHFGVPDHDSSLERERLFVEWLEMARQDASEIFLMGDLFDFWFEYKYVIPRGYVRLLGKLAEITGSGIKVHLFRGNHDMWAFNYLNKEIHIEIHRDPEIRQFNGKLFYLAHGDGLGPGDHGYKFIKKVFQSKINQWAFRWIHPDLGIPMALFWSKKSRYANLKNENETERNISIINTRLVTHSKKILETNPGIDYFIYGHWHHPMDIPVTDKCRQLTLGDWITHFTYAVFGDDNLQLLKYQDTSGT
jgi:UDP-2,3-diacylglucosamine hydrolase